MGVVCLFFKTPGKGRAEFSGMEYWHVWICTWVYALLLADEVYGLLRRRQNGVIGFEGRSTQTWTWIGSRISRVSVDVQ